MSNSRLRPRSSNLRAGERSIDVGTCELGHTVTNMSGPACMRFRSRALRYLKTAIKTLLPSAKVLPHHTIDFPQNTERVGVGKVQRQTAWLTFIMRLSLRRSSSRRGCAQRSGSTRIRLCASESFFRFRRAARFGISVILLCESTRLFRAPRPVIPWTESAQSRCNSQQRSPHQPKAM